jgi:hypothetical protein
MSEIDFMRKKIFCIDTHKERTNEMLNEINIYLEINKYIDNDDIMTMNRLKKYLNSFD